MLKKRLFSGRSIKVPSHSYFAGGRGKERGDFNNKRIDKI